MKILCDIDSVCAGIIQDPEPLSPIGPWLDRYNRAYDDHLQKADIVKWEISEIVKPECGMKIMDFLKDPSFYDDCPPVPGALAGVRALREMGDEVIFLSAGIYPTKVRWMYEHGFLLPCRSWESARDVILAFPKEMVQADAMIDDYECNLAGRRFPILFDQPWNQEATGVIRCKGWQEVVDTVRGLHYLYDQSLHMSG